MTRDKIIELMARGIKTDDGSSCIAGVRSLCRYKDGCICLSVATAALTALESAGLCIVPKEPSEEMIKQGLDLWWLDFSSDQSRMLHVYRAMIAQAVKEGARP